MARKKVVETEVLEEDAYGRPRRRYFRKNERKGGPGGTGGLFFFGMLGSLVYWLQAAHEFGAVITAVLKSLVWPAYVVYKLLEHFYGVMH